MVVEEKQRLAEVARNLGISNSLLDKWIQSSKGLGKVQTKAKVKQASKPLSSSSDADRIRTLERQLKRAQMERDILKKAVGFFAKLKR